VAHVANVVIASSQVSEDLTNFPAYIRLSDLPAAFWSAVANGGGGGDIRCYSADGTTELAREVVSCDTTTDTGELWVLVPFVSASSDTVIQIHADGASSDYAATATYGRNAVWADYEVVMHLESDETNSTGNTTPALFSDGQTHSAKQLGGGVTFTDSSAYRIEPITIAPPWTLQCWGSLNYTNNHSRLVGLGDASTTAGSDQYNLAIDVSNGEFELSGGASVTSSTIVPSVSTLYMMHGVEATGGSNHKLYVNSTNIIDDSAPITWSSGLDRMAVGGSADASFFGPQPVSVDEARLRFDELSAAWIDAEYTNQSAPTTFYTTEAPAASSAPTLTLPTVTNITVNGATLGCTVTY